METMSTYKELVKELDDILLSLEKGRPWRKSSVSVRCLDKEGFLKALADMLASDDDEDDEDEKKEAQQPQAKEEAAQEAEQPEKPVEKEAAAEDFDSYVGGLVVDAIPVEDDGEQYYFCVADDDTFYLPKAVFDKYFVKL